MRLLRPLLAVCCFAALAGGEPVRIVFDTDMGNDIDDALALAMLHAFENRGEARVLAVTVTKDNRYAAPYIDIVNTFYGRGDLPIGVVKRGKTPQDAKMIQVPAEARDSAGGTLYPHDLRDGREAPDATAVLRRSLAAQPDASVVMVQVGFFTNFARLLESSADSASPLSGAELVKRKVKLLVLMAGQFPSGKPEYNVKIDIPAARTVLTKWPGPIVTSGFEVGEAILYPARSIENDFRYAPNHPVAHAYRSYQKMPYDRPTWDLTAVLYAVRPDRGYFSLSEPGRIEVDDQGKTTLAAAANGPHRYLKCDAVQRARVLEALTLLASEPPKTK